MNRVQELLERIAAAKKQLDNDERSLESIRRACKHQFEPVRYTPDVREAYHFEGDPVGTLGIDRRLPMDVPREETKKWSRYCPVCTLTQTTTLTRNVEHRGGKIPGTAVIEEVPIFPGE